MPFSTITPLHGSIFPAWSSRVLGYFSTHLNLGILATLTIQLSMHLAIEARGTGNGNGIYLTQPDPINPDCFTRPLKDTAGQDDKGWLYPLDVMCPAAAAGFIDCCDCIWRKPLLKQRSKVVEAWNLYQRKEDERRKHRKSKGPPREKAKYLLPNLPAPIGPGTYELPMEVDGARAYRKTESHHGWQSVEFHCVITLSDEEYSGYFVNSYNFRRAKSKRKLPKISRLYRTWCRPDEEYEERPSVTKRHYPVFDINGVPIANAISGVCIPHNPEDRERKRIRYPFELEQSLIQDHVTRRLLQVTPSRTVCCDIPNWEQYIDQDTLFSARIDLVSQPALPERNGFYAPELQERTRFGEPNIAFNDNTANPIASWPDHSLNSDAALEALQFNSLFDSSIEEPNWLEAETAHLVNFMSLVSSRPNEDGLRSSYVVQKQMGPTAQLELNINGERPLLTEQAPWPQEHAKSSISWNDIAIQQGASLQACVGLQPFPFGSIAQDVSFTVGLDALEFS